MAVTLQGDPPLTAYSKCGTTFLLRFLDEGGDHPTHSFLPSCLGYMSIFFWLNAQIPQLYTNYLLGSAASLSLPFLLIWLLGDITNFFGCILTNQLPFQRYLALYFCLIDLSLLVQFFYYEHGWASPITSSPVSSPSFVETSPSSQRESVHFDLHDEEEDERDNDEGSWSERQCLTASFHSSPPHHPNNPRALGRGRAHPPEDGIWEEGEEGSGNEDGAMLTIGMIMAWTCTCLYLSSRIPQIILNYTRGSAEGLSIWMFAFAALGNLTYVLSIALHTQGLEEWLNALPYIIGSAGTLSFDATIFAQFWYYQKKYAS
ncbi:MAG: PQ loop repeat-domain-containing protein [Piptocephalis tieghemiana]|nr:MAG: PQ loop repeat-domain-containing protein [Piptocephalis tieghemiana]